MRIVKLSELNEEEKKEYERQREMREQQYAAEQEKERQRVNELLYPTSDNTKNNRQLGNRNGFTARNDFKNNERVKNAIVVENSNTFSNFANTVKNNPQKVASILTDIGSSMYANKINREGALSGEKLLAQNFAEGAIDAGLGVTSLIMNPLGEKVKEIGAKINNRELYERGNLMQNTMKAISNINSFGSKTASKLDDKAYQISNNVSRTLGTMAPSIALSYLTAGGSTAASAAGAAEKAGFLASNSGGLLQAAGVAGNEMTRTLNEDNSNFNQAAATGLLKGTVEYATEKLFGGNIIAKNTSIDKLVTSGISKGLKSKIGQKLASKAYEFTGEIAEELISDTAGNFIDKIVNGKDLPSLKQWWENSKETARDTFLTTAVLQALGLGGGTYNEVQELNLNKQQKAELNKAIDSIKSENVETTKPNLKEQATKEIQNSKINENEKKAMLDALNNMQEVNEEDIEAIKQNINEIAKVEREQNKLPTNGNYKFDDTRKQTYAKYKNDTNTYDSSVVNEVLDNVKTNRNGKRTVKQWTEAATQIGERIANLSNEEIERIAYKSWFDVQPSKSITQYDNVGKKNVGFSILNSDTWINNIYDGVNKARENGINYNENQNQQAQIPELKEGYTRLYRGLNEEYNPNYDKSKLDNNNGYESWTDDYDLAKSYGDNVYYIDVPTNQISDSIIDENSNSETYGDRNLIYKNDKPVGINGKSGNEYMLYTDHDNYSDIKYNSIANKQKTLYNDIKVGEIKNVDIKELSDLIGEGGYRTEEQVNNLRNYIKENGITEPIEIYRKNDGTLVVNDGNHRLKIAKELGIKDIPVKFVESWENIGLNNVSENEIKNVEGVYNNGNDGTGEKLNTINETSRNREGRLYSYNEQSQDTRTTRENDGIYEKKSDSNNFESSKRSKENNRQQLEESSNEGSILLPINENTKQRKHYKSVSEAQELSKEVRSNARKLYENSTYIPVSNNQTLSEANETIQRNGLDRTYESFMSKLNSNERIRLQDIAIGERLIQIYDSMGDVEKAKELTYNVGILGTEIGQITQAFSLIKRMSPEGQLGYLQKVVERINTKENTDINITDEMAEKILKSKDQKELENNMSKVATEIAEQLPVKWTDKLRSWRYLSMLGNPRTHIRNLGANVAMNLTQNIKNKVAGAGEDIAGIFNKDFERTKTLKMANKDQKTFARQDAKVMQDSIDGGGKYDVKNVIESNKKQFNNKYLNAIAEFNTNALDFEDKIFLRLAYRQAMQNYMAANKLSSNDMTGKTLEKARQYASLQAQEATFHQFNALANAISNFENKNTITKVATGAILPFKKTPMNIAKAGIEYSPVNLARSIGGAIYDITKTTKNLETQLEKGNITEAEYKTETSKLITNRIDQMAKGLTGTSIAVIGYMLAKAGIIRAGNDDKEDEFEEKLGNQEYSIKIGDHTYTLDWLSPAAIPLFVGSTVAQLMDAENEGESDKTLNSFMTGMSKAFEPMTEMSMLQGLTNAIASYEQGSSNKIFDIVASMGQSYLGQYIPTALGQVTKTIDPNIRDTSSTKKGFEKKVEQFVNQTKAKIPGLSYTLPTKTDVWGNDKVREGNIVERYFNNAIVPYNKEKLKNDKVSDELTKVYKNTGETSVLTTTVNKDLTINKEKYTMTSKELAEYKKQYGQDSYNLLNKLVTSDAYKSLSDEQKQKAIEKIYDYAKEGVKLDYAKESKLPLAESTLTKTVNSLSSNNKEDYFVYLALTQDMTKDSEKIKTLASADMSNSAKKAIYENSVGKDDSKYAIMKETGINIKEYLNYKATTSGNKKEAVVNYVSNMNISNNQKLLLLGMDYALSSSEKTQLAQYVSGLNISKSKKAEIFSKIKGFTVYEDGRVTWK